MNLEWSGETWKELKEGGKGRSDKQRGTVNMLGSQRLKIKKQIKFKIPYQRYAIVYFFPLYLEETINHGPMHIHKGHPLTH